jgi:hypothetical protein
MKNRLENRQKLTAACILIAAAMFLTARWMCEAGWPWSSNARTANAQAVAFPPDANSRAHLMDPRLRLTELELAEDAVYEAGGRNIFHDAIEEGVQRLNSRSPVGSKAPVPLQPAMPEFPLSFFGIAKVLDSTKKVCLLGDGEIFIGGEGEIVDRRYRILRIGSSSVDVEDLLENTHHTLAMQQ